MRFCTHTHACSAQVFLPFALVQLGNAMVSMRRLNQYLVMEERTNEVERLPDAGALIEGLDAFWAEPTKAKARVCPSTRVFSRHTGCQHTVGTSIRSWAGPRRHVPVAPPTTVQLKTCTPA